MVDERSASASVAYQPKKSEEKIAVRFKPRLVLQVQAEPLFGSSWDELSAKDKRWYPVGSCRRFHYFNGNQSARWQYSRWGGPGPVDGDAYIRLKIYIDLCTLDILQNRELPSESRTTFRIANYPSKSRTTLQNRELPFRIANYPSESLTNLENR